MFWGCQSCTRCFGSTHAVMQHMSALGHWQIKCETCPMAFLYEDDCDAHMMEEGHWKNYCKDCDRHFMNENNYRAVSLSFAYSPSQKHQLTHYVTAPQFEATPRNYRGLSLLRRSVHNCQWRLSPP
jgi:hypothetical protein